MQGQAGGTSQPAKVGWLANERSFSGSYLEGRAWHLGFFLFRWEMDSSLSPVQNLLRRGTNSYLATAAGTELMRKVPEWSVLSEEAIGLTQLKKDEKTHIHGVILVVSSGENRSPQQSSRLR